VYNIYLAYPFHQPVKMRFYTVAFATFISLTLAAPVEVEKRVVSYLPSVNEIAIG
jgi:hypothetical protein